ncbi:hypothetical protein GCM10023321_11550 [Pseudonocardia eucalypti]|uniref:HD domain-containing protein n=1 Tax=Pseudonocardia eucalypti TaxID=648755 RepID=A0ABP9PM78_9PSEU|nr:hypothetical protein [Pseudonocardia eucalypti]
MPDQSSITLDIPDTELCREAWRYAQTIEATALANHSIRAFYFARATGEASGLKAGADYDEELLFVGSVLHDLGLTEEGNGADRFEVDGADLAVRFLREHGMSSDRIEVVWDAIALHTTPGIPNRKRPEIGLLQAGTFIDVFGQRTDELAPGLAEAVHAVYPRLGIEQAIAETIIDQAVARPSKAVPGTFPADLVHRMRPSAGLPSWDDMFATSAWQGIA